MASLTGISIIRQLGRARVRSSAHVLPSASLNLVPFPRAAGYATNPPPAAPSPTSSGKKPPPPEPRDDTITLEYAQLVGQDTTLSELRSLKSIRASYDQKTHTLRIVSKSPPIVRLFDRKEQSKKERSSKEKSKLKKAKRQEDVEMQVTWESAVGDVQHKVKQARKVLEDGDRVKLAFTHRAGGGASTNLAGSRLEEVRKSLPEAFLQGLEDCSQEFKPPSTQRDGAVYVLHLQPNKEIRRKVEMEVEEEFGRKSEEKEKKKTAGREKELKKQQKAAERAAEKERLRAPLLD